MPAPLVGAPAREIATESLDADALVEMVLAECHGPLRGQMDRVAAELTMPGGETVQAVASLPHSLRTIDPSGRFLRCPEGSFALGDEPRAATAAEAARLRAVFEFVDCAAFGPLYRAVGCRRLDATSFELAQPEGPPVTLRLRERSLLPAAFVRDAIEVTIEEYLRTPVTWVVERATHPALGTCTIVFELAGAKWRDDLFALPVATETPKGPRIKFATETGESRSPTPVLVEAQPVRWLVLDDPGDWDERCRIYTPLHELLLSERQRIAGFPILTTIASKAVLAIPFKARKPGDEPDLPKDARIVAHTGGRELEVWPPQGEFEASRAAAEQMLRQALDDGGLEAVGAICFQPYVHLDEGAPPPEKLGNVVMRASVRVR